MSGQPESGTELTRSDFLRGAALLALPALVGSSLGRPRPAAAAAPYRPLAIGAERLEQVRRNVFELELPFARRAWANTLAKANQWLGYQPTPTRPDADLSDWFAALYRPGLHDGNAALTLAVAYAVGGRKEHADRAKAICLAWARTYRPVPAQHRIGHLVAEPVGPVVKLCMAYDLAKPEYSPQERKEFESWAAQFVERGKRNADLARDRPWVPDVTYGEDTTNVASYGNSATWQRAMALWAAAAVGGETLRSALWWNFRHTTSGGRDYGWDDLLEGLLLDGTGGRVAEDRYRSSIEYGHFSWIPLVLVADLARNAGFGVNLFTYRTSRNGYTLFTPVSYYAPHLVRGSVPDALERTQYGGSSWPTTAARWRAAYEVLYRNASDPAVVATLRRVLNSGGAGQRGDNYDIYVLGHAALFGRGPKGPMPPPPKRPGKR
jgi:hypothetical protein